jgi:hypothetical protein
MKTIINIKKIAMKKLLFLVLLFTGIVYAEPPINNPTPFEVCDTYQSGFYPFDLLSKNNEILGSLSPTEYVLNYHQSLTDAQTNSNPINASFPYLNVVPNSQTLWVRVEEIANPTNFAITTLQLVVNPAPTVPASVSDLIVYENPYDGIAVFDLTSKDNEINNSPSIVISYYTSLADAQNDVTVIVNEFAFSGSHLQKIYARILNPITGCLNFTSFTLKVFNSNSVVYIPDNNFRMKLLSSNASNTIAKDLSGNFTSVDSNSNGEIEFTEALNISYLDVNQSNIADMTGISSFTNLTYLDCRLNLVLNNLDVSNLTSLTYLDAYYAGLITLNLTPSILNLDISANSLTGSLDLTTFTNLQTFKSGPYNGLTSLNLSGLTNLISVECSQNSLTTLNVDGCTQLSNLDCSQNSLPNLNLNSLVSLLSLDCSVNELSSLDVSNSINLQSLSCRVNTIASLNIGSLPNLAFLDCNNNALSTLDVNNCPNITFLDFSVNIISTIDLSSNTFLNSLFASGNNLTTLDLSNNSNLSQVYFTENPLTYVSLKNGNQ